MERNYSIMEAMIFSQKIAQLSKALWKITEKDWQEWIKPFNLNINEYHILWIAFNLNGSSISDIADLGVMHVSTAFNFSKKLEERGLISFSKRENDKRNTYVEITDQGKDIIFKLMESFQSEENDMISAALPLKQIFGKFPEMVEVMAIIRNLYGDKFMDTQEKIIQNITDEFVEEDGKLIRKEQQKAYI